MNKERRQIVKGIPLAAAAAAMFGTQGAASFAKGSQDSKHPSPTRKVVPGKSANLSRAIGFDRLLYVSGVLGTDANGSLASSEFEGQCRQALTNLKASIEVGGSNMGQVLKCTCFLVSASDFETMNRVYREFFPSDPPARSTVAVKELVLKGAIFEIDCVAHT